MKKRKKTDANNYSLEKMGILNLNETNKSPNTINSFPQTDEAIKRKSDAECLDNTNEKNCTTPIDKQMPMYNPFERKNSMQEENFTIHSLSGITPPWSSSSGFYSSSSSSSSASSQSPPLVDHKSPTTSTPKTFHNILNLINNSNSKTTTTPDQLALMLA